MLLRPGSIPSGDGWSFELKYDGFRAIVSTHDGLEVRSRREWNMTDRVPELRQLPSGLVLAGELVAFDDQGAPHWPLLCERVLHGNTTIAVTFVAFDLLAPHGHLPARLQGLDEDQERGILAARHGDRAHAAQPRT